MTEQKIYMRDRTWGKCIVRKDIWRSHVKGYIHGRKRGCSNPSPHCLGFSHYSFILLHIFRALHFSRIRSLRICIISHRRLNSRRSVFFSMRTTIVYGSSWSFRVNKVRNSCIHVFLGTKMCLWVPKYVCGYQNVSLGTKIWMWPPKGQLLVGVQMSHFLSANTTLKNRRYSN